MLESLEVKEQFVSIESYNRNHNPKDGSDGSMFKSCSSSGSKCYDYYYEDSGRRIFASDEDTGKTRKKLRERSGREMKFSLI
ncbi:hypothetical protein Lal_00042953 [Lupinus albus]|nr:hypothetical protein Lal_00042953 [Lupinus albus]